MPAAIAPATHLGKSIRDHRKAAGYRIQGELALRLGVTQATVSAWESGARRPEPDYFKFLMETIGVPIEDYLVDIEPPEVAVIRQYVADLDVLDLDPALAAA